MPMGIEIKETIAKDLKRGIEQLGSALHPSHRFYNRFLELKDRFNQNREFFLQGLINDERYTLESNRIRSACIELIDAIHEDTDLEDLPPADSQSNPIKPRKHLPIEPEYQADDIDTQEEIGDQTKSSRKKIITGVLVLLLVVVGAYWGNSEFYSGKSSPEEKIRTTISSYYETIAERNYPKVATFYAPVVKRYYSKENLTPTEIVYSLEKSKKSVESDSINIDWETFQIQANDEYYHVSYNADYFLKQYGRSNREFNLGMIVTLDRDLKIYSIYEIKF